MSCFRVIGQFVSEFARLILFIASIIFLLSSSLLLLFSFQSRKDFSFVQMDNIQTVLAVAVGLSAYLVVLAILGLFASFFSSKSTIKLLALMTALNVIVGIAVLASSQPKLDSVPADLAVKLTHLQEKYDWDHRETKDREIANATQGWDQIQADLHCCGVNGPSDWLRCKPKEHEKESILPISCCQSYADKKTLANGPPYCETSGKDAAVWQKGCKDEMQGTFALIMDMVIFVVSFSLVVGLLSGIVLCCRPSDVGTRSSYTNGNYR